MSDDTDLFDENVENIRRLRRKINRHFKLRDEFMAYMIRYDRQRLLREKRLKVIVKRQPMLIDDNVEDIRRVRREISSRFKTDHEFLAYVHKMERKGLQRKDHESAAKKARREKLSTAKSPRKAM